MSWRLTAAVAASLAMAGCGGSPFTEDTGTDPGTGPGTGGGTGTSIVPAAIAANVTSVVYNPAGAGTLTVVIDPLDASPIETTFARSPGLDRNGYEAFVYQETTTNRFFLALFDISSDGAATASVAASGQFTEVVWGANYTAETAFARPFAGGLASYTGNYVGLLNTGATLPGPGTPFNPSRPFRTEGDFLLNADFTNNSVEGGIRNRRIVETGTTLDDIFLTITEISATGTFGGTAEFGDRQSAGTYAGTFAGSGATAVAGGVDLTPDPGDRDLLEKGVFVGDRCAPGDPAPCP